MALRALIVDDEAEMRALLGLTLRSLGVEKIFETADAEEAMTTFAVVDVNLVFLDLNMPGENGFSILQALKAEKSGAYVIIVSGESSIDNVRKALSLGAKGFVVKPYQTAKIKDAVQRYLSTL